MADTAVFSLTYNANMKQKSANSKKTYWWRTNSPIHCVKNGQAMPGDVCTHCQKGILAFDGLFNLVCDTCGYVSDTAVFT